MRPAAGAVPVRMIVNADDFGYFDGVSQGIIEAAELGRVTATGVMANGPALDRWSSRLATIRNLSVGVHLNATLGTPLTIAMAQHPVCVGRRFPGKATLVAAVLRGTLPVDVLLDEWHAQIERCLQHGLQLEFVNSHEHVHALPPVYRRLRELAAEYRISHVRVPRPEWRPGLAPGVVARNLALAAVGASSAAAGDEAEPVLIGMNPSGKLDAAYCAWRFPRLAAGARYELMCHPGRKDASAQADPRLRSYHDWEGELAFLLSERFVELLRANHIELISFDNQATAPCAR